jgi:hypothetical protein
MNVKVDNFIGVFENAFSKEYCEDLIESFEKSIAAGFGLSRQVNEGTSGLAKKDTQLFNNTQGLKINIYNVSHFNEIFWSNCYPKYEEQYPQIKDSDTHGNYSFKLQKTNLKEGYHLWHYESSTRSTSNRLLTWMLYLNDVEEGGETEFLYQSMRIKPKQGTLVIWPAAFTHTHRGNPPLSNAKYIVTGWTEF